MTPMKYNFRLIPTLNHIVGNACETDIRERSLVPQVWKVLLTWIF